MIKNKGLLIFILVMLGACASNPIIGTQDRNSAIGKCYDEVKDDIFGPSFLNDGHLYTTLVISDIVQLPLERQLVLSYYTQYPDLDRNFEATPVALKYLLIPWRYSWRNNITGKLHSLHGGDSTAIQKRRRSIKEALHENIQDPSKDWLSGLLIHAYGDAFAHTKNAYATDAERAYGKWIGHVWPTLMGKSPDDIKLNQTNEDKYFGYIRDFYSTIYTDDSSDLEFNRFIDFVDAMTCPTGNCSNFHAEYNNQDPKNTRIDIFVDCMNKTSKALTAEEVSKVFKLIE